MELCGCAVPQTAFIGSAQLTFPPRSLASGQFTDPSNHGIVVGTTTSLQYLTFISAQGVFETAENAALVLNTPQDGVATAQLNAQRDAALDVVAFSRAACAEDAEGGITQRCSLAQARPANEQGCVVLHLTAEGRALTQSTLMAPADCRRVPLDYEPLAMCTGRINNDTFDDFAISTTALPGDGRPGLVLYASDGNGGLLLPPTIAPLDVGGAGPLICFDVDQDGLSEVIMVDPDHVHIFSAR